MTGLIENQGIPRRILIMMAIVAGFTVANLYYNQPLLDMMRESMGSSEVLTNLITVITQLGYAFGLCFIIPMGDLYSRRKIIMWIMSLGAIMSAIIALAGDIKIVWGASFVLGLCSVIPQLFIPIAGQFSRPENKSRNIGFVLSGLLTGILSARVLSGFVGHWWGWRSMYFIASGIMAICLVTIISSLPEIEPNYKGNYRKLMKSVADIFLTERDIRFYAIRAAFGFGSMLCIWSCMAFHIVGAPFYQSSDMVGMLGLCGVAGALSASGLGKYVPKFGVFRFSLAGTILQILAWISAWIFGGSYSGLIIAIILIDIGVQCIQLSNQSACIACMPSASNRVNTIFMTIYFIGGSAGTFISGLGWGIAGWTGVCITGLVFTSISLILTLLYRK